MRPVVWNEWKGDTTKASTVYNVVYIRLNLFKCVWQNGRSEDDS